MQIHYSLTKKADKATIKILDYTGKTVREMPGKTEPGLHLVPWDMTGQSTRQRQPGSGRGQGGAQRYAPFAAVTGPMLLAVLPPPRGGGGQIRAVPGMYRVVLTVDGQEYNQGLRIEADPTMPPPIVAAEEELITPEDAKPNKGRDDDDDDDDMGY